jgi:glucosamine kinase
MILIADSGSTKCDWALLDQKGKCSEIVNTVGLNPYFHNEEFIYNTVNGELTLRENAHLVTHVFLYGAGSSTPHLCEIVTTGLKRLFTKAEVHVDHDLLGAAYATYDGRPCISCILGTGSNSCAFDGTDIWEEIPSLAFIVGDEASGSYFGKILLREYFYKQLPAEIHEAFEREFSLDKDQFVDRVYNKPHANVYLAGFMKFIGEFKNHPHVQNWIVEGMRNFIRIHVKCFDNWENWPVHFVGSIGYYFRHCLEIAAEKENIEIGRVVRQPIDGLVEYHVEHQLKEILA